jgi:hypothetical protein
MFSCQKCGKKYTDVAFKLCKPCQIHNLKGNFTIGTAGMKKLINQGDSKTKNTNQTKNADKFYLFIG